MPAKPNPEEVEDLKAAIDELRRTYRRDQVDMFTAWILGMLATDDEAEAANCVVNRKNERNIDGICINDDDARVTVTQTKYNIKTVGRGRESRNDIVKFAELADALIGDEEDFERLLPVSRKRMDPTVRQRCIDARRAITSGYSLHLVYATLAPVSEGLRQDAQDAVERHEAATVAILDWQDVFTMLDDYIHMGFGPLVRSVKLDVFNGTVLLGPDTDPTIESWVFSVPAATLAEVYQAPKNRLFARNVRAPLGETEVNNAIQKTLRTEPDHFWFFNNGLTIVCDRVEENRHRGNTEALTLHNPQIINGQQTTVSVAGEPQGRDQATVITRVIKIPRDTPAEREKFNSLVSRIVAATNWQNQIGAADLRSTDPIQIEIARHLYRLDYGYIRKRGQSTLARVFPSSRKVRKEDLAKAIADCTLGPAYSLIHGESALFSPKEKHYDRIFRDRDPDLMLACHWMRQNVTKVARGRGIIWKHARLVVQYFLWKELKGLKGHRRTFREESELWSPRSSEFTAQFTAMAGHAFRSAAESYKRNAGTGANRVEANTYFKGKERAPYKAFENLWIETANQKRRQRFDTDKDRLLALLVPR